MRDSNEKLFLWRLRTMVVFTVLASKVRREMKSYNLAYNKCKVQISEKNLYSVANLKLKEGNSLTPTLMSKYLGH